MYTVTLTNTTILTAEGAFLCEKISADKAIRLCAEADRVESAIGHEAAAQALTLLLRRPVKVNRTAYVQDSVMSWMIALKLRGRLEEGVILDRAAMEKIGFDLFLVRPLPPIRVGENGGGHPDNDPPVERVVFPVDRWGEAVGYADTLDNWVMWSEFPQGTQVAKGHRC